MEKDSPTLEKILAARPHFERYTQAMNSSQRDKLEKIAPHLTPYLNIYRPHFLSVGAGTGVLETSIAQLVQPQEGSVIAVDLSLPMLESLTNGHRELSPDSHPPRLWPVQADILNLPLPNNSQLHAIIASSCIHEIASFEDGFEFGKRIEKMFMSFANILLPGGRLIIRDFIQPDDPWQQVVVTIGHPQPGDPISPTDFVRRFTAAAAWDNCEVATQLKTLGTLNPGSRINMTAAQVTEYLAHFSWARSFNEESKERYAYLPVSDYAQFVVDVFANTGVKAKIIQANSYLQSGYAQHLQGRFELETEQGTPYPLPNFTGIIVIEKSA